jgi:hypothetical protein
MLTQAISDLPAPFKDGVDGGELPRPSVKLAAPEKVETFHGFVVPQEPQAPGPDGESLRYLSHIYGMLIISQNVACPAVPYA